MQSGSPVSVPPPTRRRRLLAFALTTCLGVVVLAAVQGPRTYHLTGDFATHDPSIAQEGRTYYVFATGRARGGGQLPMRCSDDLEQWKLCGHVFDALPQWITEKSPGTRDLWAPDISFSHGQYRLYYAYSLFGKNTSGIALATNKTLDPASPDYKWVDRGLVLESHATDDFNAIDPNYIEDDKHRAWLAFGSFWGGIKMRALDPATGLLSPTDSALYSLATRAMPAQPDPVKPGLPPNWQAIEAPFILRHDGFYYLFVSWDICCKGAKSTYRTMVGRSKLVTGPYVDQSGTPMQKGGGSPLLASNARWVGPGGESLLHRSDGSDLIVFHAYDATTGRPSLQISDIAWHDGWPSATLGSE